MSIDILSMVCRQHEESHESDETEVHCSDWKKNHSTRRCNAAAV